MIRRKTLLPVVVFGVCLFLLSLSLWVAGRGPEVTDIQPRIADPGETLVIQGRNFGETPGRVSIGGLAPAASDYIAWTPRSISMRVPNYASSGMVHVITAKGESRGILFTNRRDIPALPRTVQEPGPRIASITPARGATGGLITLSGTNFGHSRGESHVFFSRGDSGDRYIAASAETFDYEGWSNGVINVRVPTGAASGAVMVRTAQGDSNTVYFDLDQSAGRMIFSDRKSYTIVSSLEVTNTSAAQGGSLHLWIPRVQETPCQRNVVIIAQEPAAGVENHRGLTLFSFREPRPGVPHKIEQTITLERYAVESRVDPARMPLSYDTGRPLYRAYTRPDEFVPSGDPQITTAAAANGGREANPYLRARRLYDYVLARLEFSAEDAYTDAAEGLQSRRGDAYTYATLYAALLRSSGIPARVVGGYLAGESQTARPHFWTELYLPNFGWLPADPALGDGGGGAAGYFFGGITNRHIIFARGLLSAKMPVPHGRAFGQENKHSLQTVYTVAAGGLESYSGRWQDLRIIEGR